MLFGILGHSAFTFADKFYWTMALPFVLLLLVAGAYRLALARPEQTV